MRNSRAVLLPILGLNCCAVASAATGLHVKGNGAQTFYADNRAGNGQVSIFSESTLEDFTIVCNRIGGECKLDPQNLETLSGRFSLRVEDMKTGIALRDEHMKGSDWLDAAQYPQVVIKIDKAQEVERVEDSSAKLTLIGSCTVHGQKHDVRIPATLTYLDETPQTMKRVKGDLIRVRAAFSIKLSDYGITGPKGSDTIGLKVADKLEIKVTVFGSTQKPPEALAADATTQPADASSEPAGGDSNRRPPPRRPPPPRPIK